MDAPVLSLVPELPVIPVLWLMPVLYLLLAESAKASADAMPSTISVIANVLVSIRNISRFLFKVG
jgi:hypothetical protein